MGPRRGGPCSGSAGPLLITWPVPSPVFPDGQHTLGSGLQGSGSPLQKDSRESLWEPQAPGGSPGVEPSGHGSQSPCPDLRLGGRRQPARWRWAEGQASGPHSPSQPSLQRKHLRSCQIPTCLLCGPDPPGPTGPSRRLSPVWTLCGRKRKERPARAEWAYPSL